MITKKISSLVLSLVLFTSIAMAEKKETVVAEINGETITESALEKELGFQLGGTASQMSDEEKQQTRVHLLDKMIDRRLLSSAAAKAVEAPSEEDLNGFIEQMYQSSGSKEAVLKELAERGVNEKELKEGAREDLKIMKYLEEVVFKDIKVSDEELEKFYKEKPEMFVKPEEVTARHILFKVAENAPEDEVKSVQEKAEKVLQEVKAAPDKFAEVATKNSDDSSKSNGGDLGYFTKEQMVKPFADASFALKPGEVSDLVRSQFGFHIIKSEGKRGGEKVALDEVKDRLNLYLKRMKQKDYLVTYLADLRKKSNVKVNLK